VTEFAKTGLITCDRRLDFSLQTHEYTIKFHCQNHRGLNGLLLLAVFSKLSGEPYERFEALIDLWLTSVWLYSFMVTCAINFLSL